MAGKPWTQRELYLLAKAAKIYGRQWALIQLAEFSDRTQRSIWNRGSDLSKAPSSVDGEHPKLRIESDPESVYLTLKPHIDNPMNRATWPAALLKYAVGKSNDLSEECRDAGINPDAVLQKIRKAGKSSIVDLANEFDCAPRKVHDAIETLRVRHNYLIEDSGGTLSFGQLDPSPQRMTIPVDMTTGGEWIRFGAITDSHLGSKWERLDVLNALFDIFEREGITSVYHAGNIVEGESRFNLYDILVHGIEAQTQYCVKNFPARTGITTYYITADDHEGWWVQREGINWGRHLEQSAQAAGRSDLVYLSHVEHDIEFEHPEGSRVMRIVHPGGGTAYALSYTVQKLVESYSPGEKPHILLVGHYHKSDYCYPRGVHAVQLGTTQDQSRFMRKKKLDAHVGGWLIEFKHGPAGEITRFRPEFFPFYDKGFYSSAYEVFDGVVDSQFAGRFPLIEASDAAGAVARQGDKLKL